MMKQIRFKGIALVLMLIAAMLAGCGRHSPVSASSASPSSTGGSEIVSGQSGGAPVNEDPAGNPDSSEERNEASSDGSEAGEPSDGPASDGAGSAPASDEAGSGGEAGDAAGESSAAQSSADVESVPEQGPSLARVDLTVRFGDDGAPFAMHLYDNPTALAIAGHVGTAAWRLPIYHYDDFENAGVMQYYDIPNRYEIPSAPETITSEKAGEVYYSDPNRIVLFYQDAEVTGEYTRVGYFDPTGEFVSAVENNPVLEGWGNKIVNISPAE